MSYVVNSLTDDIIDDSFFPMNLVRNYQGISKPLLAAQVTELVDGMVIGCSINHGVIDGPLSGISSILVHIPFSQIQTLEKLTQQTPSSSFIQRAFHFPKEKVAKLKAKANAEMGTNTISSLQALVAHLWRATTRGRHDLKSDEETTYRIAIGLRQRLKPPFPNHYMGNAILVVQVKALAVRSGPANKNNGTLTVYPGAEEGSVEFEVCLLPETLHAMADDVEFMDAVLT
ncbi:hypothetical protein ACLB2K_008160 [Fragaria x ananassa]